MMSAFTGQLGRLWAGGLVALLLVLLVACGAASKPAEAPKAPAAPAAGAPAAPKAAPTVVPAPGKVVSAKDSVTLVVPEEPIQLHPPHREGSLPSPLRLQEDGVVLRIKNIA